MSERGKRAKQKGWYLVSLLATKSPEIPSLERSEEGCDFGGFEVVGSSWLGFSRGESSEEDIRRDPDGD